MTKMRKAIITIEVNTTLTGAELRDVQALVFGRVRRETGKATTPKGRTARATIRREVPKWIGHDTQGTITQVQVNVVDRPSREPKVKKAG
jgi:hypothetical protein